MADEFLHNYKQPSEDMEFINKFSCLNPIHQDISALNLHSFYNILPNLEPFPPLFIEEASTVLTQPIISSNTDDHRDRKRKAIQISMSQTTSENSSTQLSADGSRKPKNRVGKGKKGKDNVKEDAEKPREVIHVRAKRGEATDSHSLAERVRRGKINERLRCLQDIVPGCYKTMGMSVMLDEIINYVQSLQNQVEFLSMKLTAASTFHDFNSDIDAIETMQRAEEFGALKIQNVGRQEELLSAQLFASQLPYNR